MLRYDNLFLFVALKSGEGVPDGCEVVAIMKRRDPSEEDGDVSLKQKKCTRYSMEQFLIVKEEGDDTVSTEEAEEAGRRFCSVLNEMAATTKSNFDKFVFQGDVTSDVSDDDLHSLDYYAITSEVVGFAKAYFSDELDSSTFFHNEDIVSSLFERKSNLKKVEFTMNRYG